MIPLILAVPLAAVVAGTVAYRRAAAKKRKGKKRA